MKKCKKRGQSLVEFALSLPLLFLLCMAGMDMAHILSVYNALVHATEEGTRLASETNQPTCAGVTIDIQDRIMRVFDESSYAAADPNFIQPLASCIPGFAGGNIFALVLVVALYQFDDDSLFFVRPVRTLFPGVIPNPVTLTVLQSGLYNTSASWPPYAY